MRQVRFVVAEDGASAVEFALVVFPFFAVVLAGLGLGFMMWANSTLHYAAEDAARCAAYKTSICPDVASTQSYATKRYAGPGSPVFHATNPGCDGTGLSWTVTGSATYPLNAGLFDLNIPLSASACFLSNQPPSS